MENESEAKRTDEGQASEEKGTNGGVAVANRGYFRSDDPRRFPPQLASKFAASKPRPGRTFSAEIRRRFEANPERLDSILDALEETAKNPNSRNQVAAIALLAERNEGKVEQKVERTSTVQRVVISASLAQPIAQLQTPQHTSEIEKREVGSGTMQDDIATLPASSDCSGSMSSDVSLLTSELSKRVVMLEQSQRDILAAQEKTMEMLRSLLPR